MTRSAVTVTAATAAGTEATAAAGSLAGCEHQIADAEEQRDGDQGFHFGLLECEWRRDKT